MKLTIETMNWRERKRLGNPDMFHWLKFERQHRKPRTGPDAIRSHEYTLWILIGWGGVKIELTTDENPH